MALERSARGLAQCLSHVRHDQSIPRICIRTFTNASSDRAQVQAVKPPTTERQLDRLTVATPRMERRLIRIKKQMPVGSRRRRAAMKTTTDVPFEQLPYQCFQEARAFLQEDRSEKIKNIEVERSRIDRLRETVTVDADAAKLKERRLDSMRDHLEHLKILADINDPLVKKTFEDGHGDLSKPIYRYLADQKWRSYERKIAVQRIEQMHVTPDILPSLDPTVATTLSFAPTASIPGTNLSRRKNVRSGDFVDSRVSEKAPHLHVQSYTKGEQLVTIALINPDVPDVENDSFHYRCHFLACNVPISPTQTLIDLNKLNESQVIHNWLPAYSQKGAPYQRMAFIVLAQPPKEKAAPGSTEPAVSSTIKLASIKEKHSHFVASREKFNLHHFADVYDLRAVGAHLFRTQWDEGTAGVMQRAKIPGWDVEFKPKKILPLPYQRLKEERYR